MRILAEIVALVTRRKRQRVPFPGWSSSWVVNAFTLWRAAAWAPLGIRPDGASNLRTRTKYSFTLENQLAVIEWAIRSFFARGLAFRIVRVPQLQIAGMRQLGLSPYRFAIAFDVSTDLQPTVPAGSNSGNHTVTGANPILFGMGWGPITDVNGITAMTYNSAALTFLNKNGSNGSVRWAYQYVLMAPSTGTNSLAYTAVLSDACDVVAISYSGAAQTGQPDASNSALGTATTSLNCSITVVASDCWIVAFGSNDQGAATFTGTNRKNLGGNTARPINDSNGTVATGSNTYTESWTGSGAGVIVMASFSPFVASPTTGGAITMMGVG